MNCLEDSPSSDGWRFQDTGMVSCIRTAQGRPSIQAGTNYTLDMLELVAVPQIEHL